MGVPRKADAYSTSAPAPCLLFSMSGLFPWITLFLLRLLVLWTATDFSNFNGPRGYTAISYVNGKINQCSFCVSFFPNWKVVKLFNILH